MAEPFVRIPIIQSRHLQLWTPSPTAPGRRAKLAWCSREGNPRITVFTNDPADVGGKGIIAAPMSIDIMLIFLAKLEAVANSKEEVETKIDCFSSIWVNGQNTNERKLVEVKFGKNAAGMVWISLISAGQTPIVFHFRISEWHGIYNAAGVQITEGEGSAMAARATVSALRHGYQALFGTTLGNAAGLGTAREDEGSYTAPPTEWGADPARPSTEFDDLPM